MTSLSKSFAKISKMKVNDSPSMTRALLQDDENKKKRTHRRSQSTDSTDSFKDLYVMKSGKARRRLQWKALPAVKDLLVSTSLLTIDGDSLASNGGRTCVTEGTACTASCSLSQTNSGKKNHQQSETNDEPPLIAKQPSKPRKARPKLVRQIGAIAIEKEHAGCTGDRALALREYEDHGHILQETQSNERVLISSRQDSSEGDVDSLLTPAEFNSATNSLSGGTPLTPLAPKFIAFDSFQSPQSLDHLQQRSMDMDHLEIPALDDDHEDDMAETSFNECSISMSSEIGILLCPTNYFNHVTSPLTPSPQLNSPPPRRRSQGPQPLVLDKALSANNEDIISNNNDEFAATSDYEYHDHLSYCHQSMEDSSMVSFFEMQDDNDATPQRDNATKNLPSEVQNKLIRRDESAFIQEKTMMAENLAIRQSTEPKLDRRAMLSRQRTLPLLDRRAQMTCPEGFESRCSMRTISKSIPVDIDEGTFVDVQKNFEAIEIMASQHLEQGEYEEAVDVYRELLRARLEQHGHEHEEVGLTLHNLASIHMKQKAYEKAVQVGEKAVSVRKMALGVDDPEIAVSLVQVGLANFERQDYDSATLSFQEALQIRRKMLGSMHLKVAKVLNNLGCTLKQASKIAEAVDAFEEALSIQQSALESVGKNSSKYQQLSIEIVSTLSNICTVKLSLGHYEEALGVLEDALQIQRCIFCDDHPEIKETSRGINFISNLVKENDSLYGRMGEF